MGPVIPPRTNYHITETAGGSHSGTQTRRNRREGTFCPLSHKGPEDLSAK